MLFQGFQGITGAGGIKTATAAQIGADRISINADEHENQVSHDVNRCQCLSSMVLSSWVDKVLTLFLLNTTISQPARRSWDFLKLSRIKRFTLLRATEPDRCFFAIPRPSLGKAFLLRLASIKRPGEPLFTSGSDSTCAKSLDWLILRQRGNPCFPVLSCE